MTDEIPPKSLKTDYETGIVAFNNEYREDGLDEVTSVVYAAVADGPDEAKAGFVDELLPEDKVDGPPEGINGWTTIGLVYLPYEEGVDAWTEPIEMTGYDDGVGLLEVRLSLMEDAWWTEPVYTLDRR